MRKHPNMRVEKFRVREGELGSDSSYGNNGAFLITMKKVLIRNIYIKGQIEVKPDDIKPVCLRVIISDGDGWDHVSVSIDVNPHRLPTWEEMVYVKNLFFTDDETVIQFHPKKSEYINCHPFVLYMWRPQSYEVQLPPSWMVGPKEDRQEINK